MKEASEQQNSIVRRVDGPLEEMRTRWLPPHIQAVSYERTPSLTKFNDAHSILYVYNGSALLTFGAGKCLSGLTRNG